MKSIKLSPKTKLFIGLFIIIITIVSFIIFSPSHPNEQTKTTPANTPTTPIPLPQITTSLNTPNQFIWQIDHLKLPKEIELISIQKNPQGETILKNLAKSLNFKSQPTTIPNSPLIVYNNPLEATNLYLNKEENLIKFSLDLLQKPLPKNTTQPKSLDQINQETIIFLQKALNLPPSISITKNSTHYQTTNGPRFIDTTPDQATLIKTTYNYQYESFPILFPKGNSIETIHTLSGKLVKLSLNLPFTSPQVQKTYPVKTIEEIKNTPRSQFTTILLSGNEKFTLSDQEIDIDSAYIDNALLGYLSHPDSSILDPFIFLTGSTDSQYGPVKILLGIPALSPSSYNQ